MPLHPQGPKPCTLNETELAAPVYIKVVNIMSYNLTHHNEGKSFIIIKIHITCEQVSSKNNFGKCAKAGCYNELALTFILVFADLKNLYHF